MSTEARPITDNQRRAGTVVLAALVLVSVIYLLQALTPLRLDNDSVVYLHMATGLVNHVAIDSTGLPSGYPALVALLEELGLGRSIFFVLVNCAFLALGIISTYRMFEQRSNKPWAGVALLTLLSVPLIRYVTMPLPELTFFGTSLLAVAVMSYANDATGIRRLRLLAVALVLTAISVTVRFVGLALVPALLWTCVGGTDRPALSVSKWTQRDKILAGAVLVVIALVAMFALRQSFPKYASEMARIYFGSDALEKQWQHLAGVVEIVGETVLNIPMSKLRAFQTWFLVPGLAAILCMTRMRRIEWPRTPVAVYLLTFLLVLLIWPYNTIRLWVPVIPLLIAYAATLPARAGDGLVLRVLKRLYIGWFVLAGIVGLAYTSRITFSGAEFPNVYGMRGGLSEVDAKGQTNEKHDANARFLMRRYGNPFIVSLPPKLLGIHH